MTPDMSRAACIGRDPESPDVLADGHWENVRGIQRWIADPQPIQTPQRRVKRPQIEWRNTCPVCSAQPGRPCRTPNGHWTDQHRARKEDLLCACGAPLAKVNSRYCEACRVETRRYEWRVYAQHKLRRQRAAREQGAVA